MKLNSMQELYLDQLHDIYSAEKQLISALPKMADAASSPELRDAFTQHLSQTEQQKERLDQIFQHLQEKPKSSKKCKAMEGLIAEGDELLKAKGEPAVLDAALIAAAQRIEHYEIAGYGCLRTFAMQLGHQEDARVLEAILQEERDTDELLTRIAESSINNQAREAQR